MDVEFLPDDGSPHTDGEVLPTRRRRPRWTWLIATVVVAAAVAVAVTHQSPGQRSSAPTVRPSSTVRALGPPATATAVPLTSDAPVLDVLTSGHQTWVLQAGQITLLDNLSSRRSTGPVSADASGPGATPVLVMPGGTDGRLWLVIEGTTPGQVIEYDAYTLARGRTVQLPEIRGAATLDGKLYLTSGRSLIQLGLGAAPRTVRVPGARGGLGSLAADPGRSRLIILDEGYPTRVWLFRPATGISRVPVTLPFAKGSIAVAHGAIWVGGFAYAGAILFRLDPVRLTTVDASQLNGRLGPGAVVVAGGEHVYWVRGGGGGDDLWCVDASTGDVEQHWNIAGPVSSTAGTAVIAAAAGVSSLSLDRCIG